MDVGDGEGSTDSNTTVTPDSERTQPMCHASAPSPTHELSGTGIVLGETAYDFELNDQHGDTVSLYAFHGCVVVLDLITQWCSPCKDAAPELEAKVPSRAMASSGAIPSLGSTFCAGL